MLIRLFVLILLLTAIAAAWWYNSPIQKLRRQTDAVLRGLEQRVATGSRESVIAYLSDHLTDDAEIQLDVAFYSFGPTPTSNATQLFQKESFLRYIDNLMYASERHRLRLALGTLTPKGIATLAAYAEATAKEYQHGLPRKMAYTLEGPAEAQLRFTPTAQLQRLDAKITVRMQPEAADK
jgi:hypothetical protein